MRSGESTTIDVPESSAVAKGKAPLVAIVKQEQGKGGWKRGVAILDHENKEKAITENMEILQNKVNDSFSNRPLCSQFLIHCRNLQNSVFEAKKLEKTTTHKKKIIQNITTWKQ